LGAGGGGFILLFISPEKKKNLIEKLSLMHVPFEFENGGSRVLFYKSE
jgi:D-glycero-alpha-D-manno-heptose-7-phosphate kinase